MHAVYDLSFEDVMAFQERVYRTNPQTRKSMRFVRYGFPILLVAMWSVTLVDPKMRLFFCLVVIIAALWFFFIDKIAEKLWCNNMRKTLMTLENQRLYGKVEMEADKDNIRVTVPAGQETIFWNGIIKTEESDRYFFLYLSGINALIVPKYKLPAEAVTEIRSLVMQFVAINNML